MPKKSQKPKTGNPPAKAGSLCPFLRATPQGVVLLCRIQPRASRDEVVWDSGASELKVRVTAPPVENEANERLCRFLAKKLGCGRSQVRILTGERSRHKQVLVIGLKEEEIQERLGIRNS